MDGFRRHLRPFRLLAVATALLVFTAQTLAAVGAVRSCQMQMAGAPPEIEQQLMDGDCCPSDENPNASCSLGKGPLPGNGDACSACKAGYNCKNPQSCEPASVLITPLTPAGSSPSAPILTAPPSHSPEGLWRPPARL